MEKDILDSLEQLGYSGPLLQEKALLQAAETGLASRELMELCTWLSSRLKELCELEESITSGPDEESLRVELSCLLKELHCPFGNLACGIVNDSQHHSEDYLKCVLFLCSELQAAQILNSRKPSEEFPYGGPENEELKNICESLQLPQPTAETDVFSQIHSKVENVLRALPGGCCGHPVLKSSLSCEQWVKLQQINMVLSSEYECRKRMLIKRLDVTIQSFGWSDRAKVKVDIMARVYQPRRHSLSISSSVDMSVLLAAREDLCNVVKTSSGASREKTCCAVNKVLMGRVPDRGGRPAEIEPPPPEMPTWQKRQDGGGRGWGSRGGGGWRGSGGGRQCWNQGHGGGHRGQGGAYGGGHGGYGEGHSGHRGSGNQSGYGGHGGKRGRYQY